MSQLDLIKLIISVFTHYFRLYRNKFKLIYDSVGSYL